MGGQQLQQRQLVLAVEGTAALGSSWQTLLIEYIEKIVRAFCEEANGQKAPGEMALVVFYSHGPHTGCLLQQSGWTSSLEVFFKWLSSISFVGAGFGEAAIAEGLAEGLMMCCPGPNVPPPPQGIDRQKHCILVAASNPHRLPTPVIRPPVPALMQQSANGEFQAEQWWLADGETVAKAFPQCHVSLSIIAPRQLPLLRAIYNGAKRNPRALEPGSDTSKQYPQHLVLLSEGFMEGRMALRRAVVTSNALVAPGITAKVEHQNVALSTLSNPSQPPAAMTGIAGRQTSNGVVNVKMEAASGQGLVPTSGALPSLLHSTVGTPPLQMQHPSSSGHSGPDTLQTSETSASNQDFKPPGSLAANSAAALALLNNTPSQARHGAGTNTLGTTSVAPAGMSSASMISTGVSNPLSIGQSTTLGATGSQLGVVGVAPSSVGMGTGINVGQNTLGVGAHGNNVNLVGTSSLSSGQGGSTVNSMVTGGQPGVGLSQVSVTGGGQPQPTAPGVLAGLGGTPTVGLGTAGVSSGAGTMIPTPGLTQPGGQGIQSHGASNSVLPSSLHGQSAGTTLPQQQQQQQFKYTKLWEGVLAGQRQGKPVPICKLEPPNVCALAGTIGIQVRLAADWPATMQIVRLIAQDYMNSKDYQGRAELLVFRPLSSHGFLVQLAEKKLCAVIQLPSQTLLLASTERPGRMIGMLFPGDKVVFKPQLSSSGQPAGVTGGATVGAAQSLGQTMGQTTFSQGQLSTQQARSQLMPGPASLQGSSFLP